LSSKATIYTFLVIGLLVTLALIVAPVAYAISLSFYKLDSFVGHAKWVGFENYAAILKLPEFWRALWNGVVYSLGSIVLQVVLGIGFALILNETFPGRNFVRGLSILPYLLPTVVVILTFKWMVDGSIGIITKGDRGYGASAGELVREFRRGDEFDHPGQRLDVDALRNHVLPGGASDNPHFTLRGREG
jgi:multiple sugar transport system permease protein